MDSNSDHQINDNKDNKDQTIGDMEAMETSESDSKTEDSEKEVLSECTAEPKQTFDSILGLYYLKTNEIQNNLLDLISTFIDYQKEEQKRLSLQTSNRLLVNKSIFNTITEFIPQLAKNFRLLSQTIQRKAIESQTMRTQLDQCLRREKSCKQQLEVVRKVYHELKEELDWSRDCEQMLEAIDSPEQNSCPKLEFNKFNDYFKPVLALIWKSTQNDPTVQLFMQSEEDFQNFMTTLLNIIQTFVSDYYISKQNRIDSELIESICGICVNIFGHKSLQNDEIVLKDIDQWIDCLIAVNQIDTQFNADSLKALINISFNRRALDVMLKRDGFVAQLAQKLVANDMEFEYNLKTLSLKAIHYLIRNSNDTKIRIKLYKELIQVLPISRIQDMIINETYPQVREEYAQLLVSIGPYVRIKGQK